MKKFLLTMAFVMGFVSNVYAADVQTVTVLPETTVLTTAQSMEASPALNAVDMQAAFQQDAQPMQLAGSPGKR